MKRIFCLILSFILAGIIPAVADNDPPILPDLIYNPGSLKPIDSTLHVKVGDIAPDFVLPSLKGGQLQLSSFRGKSNVVLSFVPAAWTPVCSEQWPGYNITQNIFKKNGATLIGISVDGLATLFAWTEQMGKVWFDVLSDFWPHGKVAEEYGVLRSNGVAERALIFINKEGIITAIQVSDINIRPPLEYIVKELERF